MLKIGNEYAATLGSDIIKKCPKTVCAAIAVSALTQGGDFLENAQKHFISEWWALFDNGIVPQKPPFPRTNADDQRAED